MKKKRLAFRQAKEGEWIQPRRIGYLMQCCDCKLIHRLNFRVVKYAGGTRTKVQFQAFRADDIETTGAEVL